jgi:hypothetical protein
MFAARSIEKNQGELVAISEKRRYVSIPPGEGDLPFSSEGWGLKARCLHKFPR